LELHLKHPDEGEETEDDLTELKVPPGAHAKNLEPAKTVGDDAAALAEWRRRGSLTLPDLAAAAHRGWLAEVQAAFARKRA
jgi:hypothetical protein